MIIGAIVWTIIAVILLFVAQGIYRNWSVYRGRATEYDALPDHLNEQSEIDAAFPDDSHYTGFFGKFYRKFQKITKPWGAFGPRSKFAWARWNFPPREIFKIGGRGPWRYEEVMGVTQQFTTGHTTPIYHALSRCQYFKRWHVAVLWPLQIQFHVYWHEKDVPVVHEIWVNEFSIKQLLFGYGPIHWDADRIFWLLSFYLGGQWK